MTYISTFKLCSVDAQLIEVTIVIIVAKHQSKCSVNAAECNHPLLIWSPQSIFPFKHSIRPSQRWMWHFILIWHFQNTCGRRNRTQKWSENSSHIPWNIHSINVFRRHAQCWRRWAIRSRSNDIKILIRILKFKMKRKKRRWTVVFSFSLRLSLIKSRSYSASTEVTLKWIFYCFELI